MFSRLRSAPLVKSVQWLVAIGLLFVVVSNIDIQVFSSIVATIPFWYYGASVALGVLALVLATIRWKILSPEYSYRELLHLNIVGFFFAFALPSTITGDVTRVALAKGGTQEKFQLTGAVITDRLLGFVSLIFLLLIGSSESTIGKSINAKSLALAAALGIVVAVLFIVVLTKHSGFVAKRIPEFITARVYMLVSALARQMSNTKGLLLALGISLVSQFVFAFGFMIAGMILDVPLGFGDYVICSAVVQVAGVLPVSVAGIGLKDVTLVTLISKSGLHHDTAAAIVLSGYPATIVLVGLGYLALLCRQPHGVN